MDGEAYWRNCNRLLSTFLQSFFTLFIVKLLSQRFKQYKTQLAIVTLSLELKSNVTGIQITMRFPVTGSNLAQKQRKNCNRKVSDNNVLPGNGKPFLLHFLLEKLHSIFPTKITKSVRPEDPGVVSQLCFKRCSNYFT